MAANEIKVSVVKYRDRKNLMMRYKDPISGVLYARTTKTTNKRDAERAAAKWEADAVAEVQARHVYPETYEVFDRLLRRGAGT